MYTRDGGEESKKGLGYFNGVFIIINNGLLGREPANRNGILMIFGGKLIESKGLNAVGCRTPPWAAWSFKVEAFAFLGR
jgi:hypothetical protein